MRLQNRNGIRVRRRRIGALVVVALAAAMEAWGEQPSPFDVALAAVDREAKKGATTVEKLEEEYLALLRTPLTETQKGTVYAHIALAYASAGVLEPPMLQVYCGEALSCPTPADVAGRLYGVWASSIEAQMRGANGERYAVVRHRAAEQYLTGLRLVLDAGAPATPPKVPPVPILSIPGPLSPDDIRAHGAAEAAAEKAFYVGRLVEVRSDLVEACVTLYAHQPASLEEMRAHAVKILPGYPAVVKQLTDLYDIVVKFPFDWWLKVHGGK